MEVRAVVVDTDHGRNARATGDFFRGTGVLAVIAAMP